MPEHLLHRAQVGAPLEQVGRERVAQQVWMDALGLEPRLLRQLAQDQEGPALVRAPPRAFRNRSGR